MAKTETRIFTKVNNETGQIFHISPDIEKIPLSMTEQIFTELKNANVLSDETIRRTEFLIEQEKVVIELYENWHSIIEFFKDFQIENQPMFNEQIREIGEKMEPLYQGAKQLLDEWIDLKID